MIATATIRSIVVIAIVVYKGLIFEHYMNMYLYFYLILCNVWIIQYYLSMYGVDL